MLFVLLLVVVVCLTIYMIYNNINQKKAKEEGNTIEEIDASLLSDTSVNDVNTESSDRGYIIDPKSSFPLTISNVNQSIVAKIRGLLEKAYSIGYDEIIQDLVPIIAEYNVKCKEVDDYIEKFRPQYKTKINEQIEATRIWSGLSEKDKKNMLHDFKAKAIDSLDIRPNCDDLALLFDIEKKDLVIDDAVKKIGFDVLYFYLKKKKDIYRIPEDHHDRKRFEGLFGAGLAIKGDGIPLETMLTSLKIKEMSSLVQDLNPPKFSKREIAIEFMNNLPDAKNRIESNIGFDSFFQIQESPEVLKDVDMDKLNLSIRYAEEISYIIGETYLRAGHAFSGIGSGKGYSNMGAIKGMKIEIIDDERCCPYCKRMANKAYPKAQCPKTPLHIGCRCTVVPLHEDEEKMLERFI